MADEELSRLEHQLGRLLRLGVVVSGACLAVGLVLHFAGLNAGEVVMRAGLILLMAIPVTRIAASFVDAVRLRPPARLCDGVRANCHGADDRVLVGAAKIGLRLKAWPSSKGASPEIPRP